MSPQGSLAVGERVYLRRIRASDRDEFLDGAIVGQFTLSQIFDGPFRNAYLGYYAFVPSAGQGYMREAFPLVLGHAFDTLGSHRLQANIQPNNARSIALVKGAGFTKEGFSRRYLMIDGDWRDHEQWVSLAEDRG